MHSAGGTQASTAPAAPTPTQHACHSQELVRLILLMPEPAERLRAMLTGPVSRRLPGSFHTSRKASPMFLLAAPLCRATCRRGVQGGGKGKPGQKAE